MQKKYHIVYKTTNLKNGKIYIGKHSTYNIDDGYMGSGKRFKDAVKHYGLENFKKEILFIFDSEEEAYKKEFEIVNEDFINSDLTYNISIGGSGNDNWGFFDEKTQQYYRYAMQCPTSIEKSKTTMNKKYGVDYGLQRQYCKDRSKQKMLEEYGVEYPFQLEEFRKKSKIAMLEKYDAEYAMQNEELKKKRNTTMIETYGVAHPMQNEELKKKRNETIKDKYGVDHIMYDNDILEKSVKNRNKTMLEKYGDICYTRTEEGKEKLRSRIREKVANGWKPAKRGERVTNGEINKILKLGEPIPEGFRKGITHFKKWSKYKTIWINDGISNIKHDASIEIPSGFVTGMIKKKESSSTCGVPKEN